MSICHIYILAGNLGSIRHYTIMTHCNRKNIFDPNMTPEEVKEKVTGKVDPLRYFEFEFYDTYIRKITYDDGNFAYDAKKEPIIGKELLLKGMLVDVSPHLIRGRLFAGELRVLDYILAKTKIAYSIGPICNY